VDKGSKTNKKIIGNLLTTFVGLLIGFFGVFLSVYKDLSTYEKLVTMLVVLIIYAILAIILGIWKPAKTWLYLISLYLPGIIFLIFYMFKEFKVLYVLYIILILAVSYFGGRFGRSFKNKKK
jgi:chromate transport protein ChrA